MLFVAINLFKDNQDVPLNAVSFSTQSEVDRKKLISSQIISERVGSRQISNIFENLSFH